jgi:putative MFS transporter
MFYAVLGEIPSIFFSLYLIDNASFGRRKSLAFFYFISIFSNFVTAYYPNGLMFFISRFTMKNIFSVLYPFTTEAYDTLNRTIGYGSACAVGRLGSIFMPYILFPLLNLNIKYPFLFLAFTSLVGTFAAYFLPYDTS